MQGDSIALIVREGLIYSPLLMCGEKRSTELEALPMLQQTLAEVTFEQYRKPTRREQFFAYVMLHRPFNVDDRDNLVLIMDELTRLAENSPVVFPVYPRPGKCLSNMALPSMVDQISS